MFIYPHNPLKIALHFAKTINTQPSPNILQSADEQEKASK